MEIENDGKSRGMI